MKRIYMLAALLCCLLPNIFAQKQLKYAKMQHLPIPVPLSAKVGRLSLRTNSVSTKPSTNKDVFDGGI